MQLRQFYICINRSAQNLRSGRIHPNRSLGGTCLIKKFASPQGHSLKDVGILYTCRISLQNAHANTVENLYSEDRQSTLTVFKISILSLRSPQPAIRRRAAARPSKESPNKAAAVPLSGTVPLSSSGVPHPIFSVTCPTELTWLSPSTSVPGSSVNA